MRRIMAAALCAALGMAPSADARAQDLQETLGRLLQGFQGPGQQGDPRQDPAATRGRTPATTRATATGAGRPTATAGRRRTACARSTRRTGGWTRSSGASTRTAAASRPSGAA
jgi:hypothetical protein